MKLLLARLVAQTIDLIVFFALLVALNLYLMPRLALSPVAGGWLLLGLLCGLTGLLQYPFIVNGQTIGKAFAGLKMVSSVNRQVLPPTVIVIRELGCKVMSCFFLCLPVFFGKPGWHELASQSRVVFAGDL